MCGSLPPSADCHSRSRSNSCIQGLSPRCCYPWTGDNTPSERRQDADLSWEEDDFSYIAAGQTEFCPSRPPSSASALLTKQNEGLCCEIWHGGKTSLQYSSQSLNTGTQDGVFGHQVLGMNDIFQDGHLLQLKSYYSPKFHIFWCSSSTSQKKKLFKETHLIKEPDFWRVLLVHTYLLLPFALRAHVVPHTVLELVSWSSRDCYGEMPGAAALTSLGFLPLISVESWFHAGLCCHWTRGLITQLFTNWLSRYLQGWFPSNLTPRVSSDLLQGPVWKLCAPYASLLPLVLYNPRQSSLCQAYLSMRHPYLHLKSFSFVSFVVSSFQCFFAFPLLFSPLWSGLMDLISFCYTDL